MERIDDARGIERAGDEPGAIVELGVAIDHRVVEAADVGDDRERAVAHGLHLRETARFEAARHDEEVARPEHAMGETQVEALDEPEALGDVVLHGASGDRERRVAGAEEDELGVEARKGHGGVEGDVDALLIDKPSDHGDQRPLGRGEADLRT